MADAPDPDLGAIRAVLQQSVSDPQLVDTIVQLIKRWTDIEGAATIVMYTAASYDDGSASASSRLLHEIALGLLGKALSIPMPEIVAPATPARPS